MSRGNILQGQASGKLGDTVLMVRNGQQLQRVYTKAGARSGSQASEASRIQRVKFGSASNQWQLYRYVCTRMYRKGKKSTQSDYNYFVKRNSHLLPYFSKQANADGVHVLQPGLFSEGNLGRIDLLTSYNETLLETNSNLYVYDTNIAPASIVTWGSQVSNLKSSLQKSYPMARKVVFLVSYVNQIDIEEKEETFVSQQITHDTIALDLYKESTTGEDSQTVKAFFGDKISSAALKTIVNAQTRSICENQLVFMLQAFSADDLSLLKTIAVTVFATDDNVGDCYSTLVSEASVDPLQGPYALWASYRTTNALRVAADSYGYQTGVMRDEVAALGNDIADAVTAYSQRLKAVSEDAYSNFMRRIGSPEKVKPVEVRKTTAEKKEG